MTAIDERLGRYRLIQRIGKGGMGEVWIAQDETLRRRVAVKVMRPQIAGTNPTLRARFVREAQAAAQVSHANVAQIYDVGVDGDTTYLALELVDGPTLRAKMRHGPMASAEAVELAIGIADGLAAAHARGIVHRDLKPENVMLAGATSGASNAGGYGGAGAYGAGPVSTPSSSSPVVPKLLDFGIAKLASGDLAPTDATDAGQQLTETGMVVGTPAYMSPEQAAGRSVDARSDVFAFGVLLNEMLTGAPTFAGTSSFELIASILRDPPRPLPPSTPAELAAVVARCLEKDSTARYADASALAAALRVLAPPASSPASSPASLPASMPTEAVTAATPLAVPAPPPSTAPTTTAPPTTPAVRAQGSPFVRFALRAAVVVAVVVVVVVVVIGVVNPNNHPHVMSSSRSHSKAKPTASQVPDVSADIEVQAAFAQAVHQFYDHDFVGAEKTLHELEAKTGRLPALGYGVLAMIRHDAAVAAKGVAVAVPGTTSARTLSLMHDALARKITDAQDVDLAELDDTYLERALVVLVLPWTLGEYGAQVQRLLDDDPAPAFLWFERARFPCETAPPVSTSSSPHEAAAVAELNARILECDDALVKGIKATGGHASLLALRARTRWLRGQLDAARDDLEKLVAAHPERAVVRVDLAGVYLDVADAADGAAYEEAEQKRVALIESVRAMTSAPAEIVAYHLAGHAIRLAADGRARDADALLDDVLARARTAKLKGAVAEIHGMRLQIDVALGRVDALKRHIDAVDGDTNATGILATSRAAEAYAIWARLMSQFLEGRLDEKFAAGMTKDVDDALWPRPWKGAWLVELGRAVDLARAGKAKDAEHLVSAFYEGSGQPAFLTNVMMLASHTARLAKDDTGSDAWASMAQATAAPCAAFHDDDERLCRAYAARGAVENASFQLAAFDDKKTAALALDVQAHLWKHADADLPAMTTASTLRAKLSR